MPYTVRFERFPSVVLKIDADGAERNHPMAMTPDEAKRKITGLRRRLAENAEALREMCMEMERIRVALEGQSVRTKPVKGKRPERARS